MKKISILAIAAAFAAATAAPVAADTKPSADPFVSTQSVGGMGLVVVAGLAVIIAAASASDGT
jgi:hypothetical protein